MTSASRGIGFAILSLNLVAPSAFAQAQAPVSGPAAAPMASSSAPAPSASDADQAELQDIAATDLAPLKQKAQTAIDLAASDPDQACQLAKDTIGLASDARQRFGVLYAKMAGEGIDMSSMAGTKANLEAAPGKMSQLADSICSGQFVAMQNDPAKADMAQIGVYMKAYTDDIVAADAEADKGNGAMACALAREGGHQLGELSGYVLALRKLPTLAPEDTEALNELDTRVAALKATNDGRLKACTAR